MNRRAEEGGLGALAVGVLGCAGLGATAGIGKGAFAVVHDAAMLPASVAFVTLVLLPTLYIASSMAGLAIRLSDLRVAILEGVRASGVVALGLVAPVLFMLVSTSSPLLSRVLVGSALLLMAVLGLRAIYVRLYSEEEASPRIAAA